MSTSDDSNGAEARAIQGELESIRRAIEINTQQQRRRTVLQWVAIGLVVIVGLVGFLDDRSDDQREDQQEIIDKQRSCIAAINARRDAEDRLTDLAKSLGARDSVITSIHDSYRDAPPPADCV